MGGTIGSHVLACAFMNGWLHQWCDEKLKRSDTVIRPQVREKCTFRSVPSHFMSDLLEDLCAIGV